MYIWSKHKSKIDWWKLSSNPSAISLLKDNPKKIDWRNASYNINFAELIPLVTKKCSSI